MVQNPLPSPQKPTQKLLARTLPVLEHVLSLLVVFLLLTGTALWTGNFLGNKIGATSAAEPQQATVAAKPEGAQIEALAPDAASWTFTVNDSASWIVSDAAGAKLGVVIATAPYAKDVQGFAGPTPLYIYVDQSGQIAQIVAADNSETADFFRRAFDGLTSQWKGKNAEQASQLKVDAVSGATFSSNAIVQNVRRALAAHLSTSAKAQPEPVIGWVRTAAVAVVLLLGAVASLRFRKVRWLRTAVLILNVGVLGFWCGQFLSLSLLRGWIANGLDPIAYLPTLLVLAVAVVLPFFRRKHHYCTWVCPYGSLQELAARLPFPKIHCSQKVYRWMKMVRSVILCLLLLTLWTGFGSVILDYEPFTAFLVTTALPGVIVIAAAFVVASCFVPHLWCRSVCPMGMLLDLSEDDKGEWDKQNASRKSLSTSTK